MPSEPDPKLSTLVSGALTDVQTLVRGEVELAKAEISQSAKRGARGGAMVGLAVFFILFALLMLAFAAAYGLVAAGLETWAAFLIVAGALLLLAVVLGVVAVLQFKKVKGPVQAQAEAQKTAQLFADRAAETAAQARAAAASAEAKLAKAVDHLPGNHPDRTEPESTTVFPSFGGTPPPP